MIKNILFKTVKKTYAKAMYPVPALAEDKSAA
jgi:hypothetical protein